MAKTPMTKLGALWEKQAKNGNIFLTGSVTINGITEKIVVFKNSWKEEASNKPDWVINLSEPMGQKATPATEDDDNDF